jgi:hypothetical protein
MDKNEIKTLFPIKVSITENVINSGKNIGTELLKNIFPEKVHENIFWGLSIGNVNGVLIKTEKTIQHEGKLVTVPLFLQKSELIDQTEITFKLRHE